MWFKDSLFQYFKMLECPDYFEMLEKCVTQIELLKFANILPFNK